jgi:TolB protein
MKYLKFLFFLPLILFSKEELSVNLKTNSNLEAIQVKEIQSNNPKLSLEHCKSLKKVLEFDFDNNGYTQTTNDKSAYYEIKLLVEDKKILCTVKDNKLNKFHRFHPIDLNGSINSDRQKIHELSDRILSKLFNVQGIASTKILYSQRTKNPKNSEEWVSEIFVSDYDGHNFKQLTKQNHYNVSPTYIPLKSAGTYQNFLYVSYRKGQPKIFRASFSDPVGKPLFTLAGNQFLPSISIDCQMVAFVSDAAGRPDLFLQKYTSLGEPDGKPRQLFSFPRATQATSSFNPDRSKIVFLSDKDGPARIYIMDISLQNNGKRADAILISKKNRHHASPAWSFDGKKIAYCAITDGIRQLWIYDLKTETEKQLTFCPKNKENPRWAPNSLHLVYNTEDEIYSELYIINLNQLCPIQITYGEGQKRFPSWEPKLKK